MRRKEEEDENKETFVTFSPINAGVSTGVLLPLLCVSPDVRLFLMFGLPSILGLLLTLVVTTFSNQCNCCRSCCFSCCTESFELRVLLSSSLHTLYVLGSYGHLRKEGTGGGLEEGMESMMVGVELEPREVKEVEALVKEAEMDMSQDHP